MNTEDDDKKESKIKREVGKSGLSSLLNKDDQPPTPNYSGYRGQPQDSWGDDGWGGYDPRYPHQNHVRGRGAFQSRGRSFRRPQQQLPTLPDGMDESRSFAHTTRNLGSPVGGPRRHNYRVEDGYAVYSEEQMRRITADLAQGMRDAMRNHGMIVRLNKDVDLMREIESILLYTGLIRKRNDISPDQEGLYLDITVEEDDDF